MNYVYNNYYIMNNKKQLLQEFLSECVYLAPPSENSIRPYIGGSEMHRLISNPNSFIKSKQSSNFNGNFYTYFGNIFENITTKFLEQQLQTEIITPKSIAGMKNGSDIVQVYTPDGLTVVSRTNINLLLESFGCSNSKQLEEMIKEDNMIVLIEIKSPATRIPKDDWDSATKGYKTQVLTGLDTIKLADVGLFADVVYRVSNLQDDRNMNYVNLCEKEEYFDKLYCSGMIGFYKKEPEYFSSKFNELILNLDNAGEEDLIPICGDFKRKYTLNNLEYKFMKDYIKYKLKNEGYEYYLDNITDLSKFQKDGLSIFFKEVLEKEYDMYFSNFNRSYLDNICEFKKFCLDNNYTAHAILPWKMMDIKTRIVYPEHGFLEQHRDKIELYYAKMKEKLNMHQQNLNTL